MRDMAREDAMTTATAPFTWTEDESGLDLSSGDVGGDYQVGPSASRRFWRKLDDGTFIVLTSYYYVTVKYRELDDEGNVTGSESDNADAYDKAERFIDVENQTQYTWCTDRTDPGGTEVNSDMRYDYPFAVAPRDDEQALKWVQAQASAETPALYDDWDGVSI